MGRAGSVQAVLEKARLAAQMEAEYQQRLLELKERAKHVAATRVQKVWRGFRARKPLRELMGWALRKNRQLDDGVRNSLTYKVRLTHWLQGAVAGFIEASGFEWPLSRRVYLWLCVRCGTCSAERLGCRQTRPWSGC